MSARKSPPAPSGCARRCSTPRSVAGSGAARPAPASELLHDPEVDGAAEAEDHAVDRERGQRPGLEVLDQEADRPVRADAGQDAAEQDLAVDAVAQRAQQLRDLQ